MAAEKADALETAYRLHHLAVLRSLALVCRKQEVAEDIVQEAFLRAQSKLPAIPTERWRAYLYRTAFNLWRNWLRRFALETRHSLTPEPDRSDLDTHDERDALWRALLRLGSRQRACLVLKYYEDLPESDIAAILDCSVGTVKSQTSRGLHRLRKELGDGT